MPETPNTSSGLTRYTAYVDEDFLDGELIPYFNFDVDGNWCRYSDAAVIEEENKRLREALKAIAEGCSFPEDDVQRAVRDRARAALSEKGETSNGN